MVVGSGLIGSAFSHLFKENDNVLIFASGVSNSLETSKMEFKREEKLLSEKIKSHQDSLFVYLSTYSTRDPSINETLYVRHKMKMEKLVQQHPAHLIFRLSNVVGKGGNPNTLINFFVNKILSQDLVKVWRNAERNLLDIDHVVQICNYLITERKKNNTIITLTNTQNVRVEDLVYKIANFFELKPRIEFLDKGKSFKVYPSPSVVEAIRYLGIDFNDQYLKKLLEKYYSSRKKYIVE